MVSRNPQFPIVVDFPIKKWCFDDVAQRCFAVSLHASSLGGKTATESSSDGTKATAAKETMRWVKSSSSWVDYPEPRVDDVDCSGL